MSVYYLDTSALVKRYVDEPGSTWLRRLCDPVLSPVLVTSQLVIAEVTSALNRRVREGRLDTHTYGRLRDAFRGDCVNEYQILTITGPLMDLACDLLERHPLRAFDAVHLAAALITQYLFAEVSLPPPVFVGADERLLNAAAAEGLSVDNPNRHI